jgi:hypothetical protein
MSYFVTMWETAYSVAARLDLLLGLFFSCFQFLDSRLKKQEQVNFSMFLLNWQIIKLLFKWTWFGYNKCK